MRRTAAARPIGTALVATAATAGLLLVTAVSGAPAEAVESAYYEQPTTVVAQGVQRFVIPHGFVDVDPARDTYTIVEASGAGSTSSTAVLSAADASGSGGAYADPSQAQAYAAALVAARGWGAGQFSCLIRLWNQESSWSMTAENASSGAYGIPQALPGDKMGPGWQDDYRVQIQWGLGYIAAVYGDPCGAWASEVSRGSY